jgi:radical SAM superfamily enzyme YgiQ (UPF0313 family)
MTTVFCLHVGFEISLAFRCLVGYARRDPALRDGVRFVLCERRMELLTEAARPANDFAPSQRLEPVLRELVEARPDVLAVSCYLWNRRALLEFCGRARALLPGLRVVAGGPDVGWAAEEVLRRCPWVDAVVSGEGEETFAEILRAVVAGRWDAVPGLAGVTARGPGGELVRGPEREPPGDLDLIPPPYAGELERHDPALERYDRTVLYETLRGCGFRCGYCLYGRGERAGRKFDEERVVADLSALLLAGYTVQVIDPIFGLPLPRAKRILARLAALNHSGGLCLEGHGELLDAELAGLMAAAGVRQVGIGLQSVDPRTVGRAGRAFDRERFSANVRALGERGVPYYLDVIYGLPDDSYAGFCRTLDFALSFPGADVEIYRLLVLPGTRFHARAADYGLVFSPEPPYEVFGSSSFPYDDVLRAHQLAQAYALLRRAGLLGATLAPLVARSGGSHAAFLQAFAAHLERRRLLGFLEARAPEDVAFVVRDAFREFSRAPATPV